jgi:transposase
LLTWDRTGFLLIYKRLERSKFRLTTEPAAGCRHVELDAGDLALMLEGVDLRGVRRHQRWRPLGPQVTISSAVL